MIVYADSSFLVSLYILDSHSARAVACLRAKPRMLVTPFHRTELTNAIYQCVFRSTLTEFEAARALKRLAEDLLAGTPEPVRFPDSAWETAIDLARRFSAPLGVRTLDTLHVACALDLHADRFWTFDDRQALLAEAAGLNTRP